ncbi:MAG: hypothetical protein EXS00_07245 [Phycisphaerales bacterium]|nr:hypothetical protein [Phycisphaerales bacterium]
MFRLALVIVGTLALAGCYSPNSGFFATTGSGFTYISTPAQPLTISIVDIRTETPFFAMDVPPQKQITFKWIANGGSGDPQYTPDRLQWEIFEANTSFGRLRNQLSCPPENCCRIDITYRSTQVRPPAGVETMMGTDDPANQAPHLTTVGGPIPNPDDARNTYDKP